MRVGPRSLFGQVLLTTAVALLFAQVISATLLYRAAEQRREMGLMNSAAFLLLTGRERVARADRPALEGALGERRSGARGLDPAGPKLPPRLRYSETETSPIAASDARHPRHEAALRSILENQGIAVGELAITSRPFGADPVVRAMAAQRPRLRERLSNDPRDLLVVALKQPGSPVWQVARLPLPARDRALVRSLVVQTLIIFIVLVGLLYLVLRRITGPLGALAASTMRFAAAGAPETPLPPTGPDDVRHLIEAHNAMQSRIGSMLDEKDVMLGAIGHDLKTPLAALRVRIESVEDEAARARMAETIEDITRTLDEILLLARIGRSHSEAETVELGAFAASVVEEFEDMGEPVTLLTEGRIVAPVHLTWLKRGLRNLVTNALRYADTARVSVTRDEGQVILRVDDDGQGIPEDRIAAMLEPFTRGEASRNRETGGAGLGLTIARAVAEQHGGTLVLSNRPEGGLRAEFRLPA